MTATGPTLVGFLAFIRDSMGVPPAALPDDSPWIEICYQLAIDLVNPAIQTASTAFYTLAVYNLGGSNLIEFTPDQSGSKYFETARDAFMMNTFVSGVIESSHDETTGNSMVVQEAFKNLTLADLQYLKTPYGRQYLAIAQRFGALWGLT